MKKTHVTQNSGNIEWYTPSRIIDGARHVLGEIDLDPASCHEAQKTVLAEKYYDKRTDGLKRHWFGRVWLNPPYARGLMDAFIDKLIDSPSVYAWLVLTNNATDTRWGQTLMSHADRVLFFNSRIKFGGPKDKNNGPLQGQMLTYQGAYGYRFDREFKSHGTILKPKHVP